MDLKKYQYLWPTQNAQVLNNNTSSVPENQESTLIFIKYMHDIVLKISFLDTNSQNWSNGSHLKLWQVIVKIRHRCEQIEGETAKLRLGIKITFFVFSYISLTMQATKSYNMAKYASKPN